MVQQSSSSGTVNSPLKKLNFLIGRWHTSGNILDSDASIVIRGMDTYEWVAKENFILHRVDVLMGTERTEAIEMIGYDEGRGSYFLQSFDSHGETIIMYATLEKTGVLKLGNKEMRAILTTIDNGSSLHADWEISEDGKAWKPWMQIDFHK